MYCDTCGTKGASCPSCAGLESIPDGPWHCRKCRTADLSVPKKRYRDGGAESSFSSSSGSIFTPLQQSDQDESYFSRHEEEMMNAVAVAKHVQLSDNDKYGGYSISGDKLWKMIISDPKNLELLKHGFKGDKDFKLKAVSTYCRWVLLMTKDKRTTTPKTPRKQSAPKKLDRKKLKKSLGGGLETHEEQQHQHQLEGEEVVVGHMQQSHEVDVVVLEPLSTSNNFQFLSNEDKIVALSCINHLKNDLESMKAKQQTLVGRCADLSQQQLVLEKQLSTLELETASSDDAEFQRLVESQINSDVAMKILLILRVREQRRRIETGLIKLRDEIKAHTSVIQHLNEKIQSIEIALTQFIN
jgi:hypothetical protein